MINTKGQVVLPGLMGRLGGRSIDLDNPGKGLKCGILIAQAYR